MKRLIILLLGYLFVISCNNEDLNNDSNQNQSLVLKSVTSILSNSSNSCTGREGKFDEQGRITEIYLCGEGTPNRVHTYTESGQINSITGHGGYIYENNVLIARGGGTDASSFYINITYANNVIEEHSTFNQEEASYYVKYIFQDNTYNQLLSYNVINTEGSEEEIIDRVTCQYDGNNNLIEILIEKKAQGDLILEPKTLITFAYDSMNNPYKIGLPENAYMIFGTPLLYYEGESILARLSDNNVINTSISNLVENTIYTKNYEYSYNSNQYPIMVTESIEDTDLVDFVFEYY